MKAKHIKSVIKRKMSDFLDNVRDKKIRDIIQNNTIVTGGSIASMLLKEKVNDFDLYFRSADAAFKVAKHFCKEFEQNPPSRLGFSEDAIQIDVTKNDGHVSIRVESAGIASEEEQTDYQYFEMTNPESGDASEYVAKVLQVRKQIDEDDEEKPKYRPVFLSSNAITLSDSVQLVMRFVGEPEQIHENYDFVHCTNYWTSWDDNLVLKQDALESLLARDLQYKGSKYPLCSIIRTRKFIQRGWSCNAGQYLKMAMQLSKLDLENPAVLEAQLTGVDVAYFEEVLTALRKRDDKRIDNAYLVELIDKIF